MSVSLSSPCDGFAGVTTGAAAAVARFSNSASTSASAGESWARKKHRTRGMNRDSSAEPDAEMGLAASSSAPNTPWMEPLRTRGKRGRARPGRPEEEEPLPEAAAEAPPLRRREPVRAGASTDTASSPSPNGLSSTWSSSSSKPSRLATRPTHSSS